MVRTNSEPRGTVRAVALAVALVGLLLFPAATPAEDEAPAAGPAVADGASGMPVEGFRPLTPEEERAAQEFLANALSRSTVGLVEEVLPDGTVRVDLQGRFQSLSVLRVRPDGTTYVESVRRNPTAAQPKGQAAPSEPAPEQADSAPTAAASK